MHFAGLQKSSLIDYPGKVSCVIFLTGCNFECPYCHNPDLARGRYPQRIEASQVMDMLAHRKQLLDGVVISGGEPTLHPGLPELCRDIRSLGYAVKLDTNGSRPDVLAQLIQDAMVDYIAMDIKTAPDAYRPPICDADTRPNIERSIRLIINSGLDHEFRTTCVRPFVDAPIIERIAKALTGARQYCLQRFQETTLLQAEYLQAYHPPGFSPGQMRRFQSLAMPFVDKCCLR
jgi:pyruvate formate lyase activating enzyme